MAIGATNWRLVLAFIGLLALVSISSASEGRKPEQIYSPPSHIEVSSGTILLETFNDESFSKRWQVTSDPDYTGTRCV